MLDTIRRLGNDMKPEDRGYVFCFTEERTSIASNYENSGSDGE